MSCDARPPRRGCRRASPTRRGAQAASTPLGSQTEPSDRRSGSRATPGSPWVRTTTCLDLGIHRSRPISHVSGSASVSSTIDSSLSIPTPFSLPRPRWRKNSSLPSAAAQARPAHAVEVERRVPRSRSGPARSSTVRCTSASRTMPPLPTDARPGLELRLDQDHALELLGHASHHRRQHLRDRDERHVHGEEVGLDTAIRPWSDSAHSPSPGRPPAASVRNLLSSCALPTSSAMTRAAPPCSRQSTNPPVEAPTSSASTPRTSMPKTSRACASLSPASRHETRSLLDGDVGVGRDSGAGLVARPCPTPTRDRP